MTNINSAYDAKFYASNIQDEAKQDIGNDKTSDNSVFDFNHVEVEDFKPNSDNNGSYWNIAKNALGDGVTSAEINDYVEELKELNDNKNLVTGDTIKLDIDAALKNAKDAYDEIAKEDDETRIANSDAYISALQTMADEYDNPEDKARIFDLMGQLDFHFLAKIEADNDYEYTQVEIPETASNSINITKTSDVKKETKNNTIQPSEPVKKSDEDSKVVLPEGYNSVDEVVEALTLKPEVLEVLESNGIDLNQYTIMQECQVANNSFQSFKGLQAIVERYNYAAEVLNSDASFEFTKEDVGYDTTADRLNKMFEKYDYKTEFIELVNSGLTPTIAKEFLDETKEMFKTCDQYKQYADDMTKHCKNGNIKNPEDKQITSQASKMLNNVDLDKYMGMLHKFGYNSDAFLAIKQNYNSNMNNLGLQLDQAYNKYHGSFSGRFST